MQVSAALKIWLKTSFAQIYGGTAEGGRGHLTDACVQALEAKLKEDVPAVQRHADAVKRRESKLEAYNKAKKKEAEAKAEGDCPAS